MVGNDRTFLTSAECGNIVNRSWSEKRLGVYCHVGGEDILTRHCKVHPKHGIAVCQLDAAANPETVLVPCFADSELGADEMLSAESQSNLNTGRLEAAVAQKTWLPTHAINEDTTRAVLEGEFSVGFSGAGMNLCNAESGTPIFRDTEDYARELVGIVTSENDKCKRSLTFTSVIRHNEFIARHANEFEPDDETFEGYTPSAQVCDDVNHVFDEKCEPLEIHSPNYPGLYANNLNCKWNFTAPRNHLIRVALTDVDIESTNHPRKCMRDGLIFSQLGKIPIQICRHQFTDRELISYRDKATLTFTTDGSVTGRGFAARVDCIRK